MEANPPTRDDVDPDDFAVTNDGDIVVFKCKVCMKSSARSPLDVIHPLICVTGLKIRMKAVIRDHPKFRFQMTKILPAGTEGSYPVYVSYLVAPYVIRRMDDTFGMADMRWAIKMTKAEMRDEAANRIFIEKRTEAAHRLLDLISDGAVWQWGTLKDWKEEIRIAQAVSITPTSGRIPS